MKIVGCVSMDEQAVVFILTVFFIGLRKYFQNPIKKTVKTFVFSAVETHPKTYKSSCFFFQNLHLIYNLILTFYSPHFSKIQHLYKYKHNSFFRSRITTITETKKNIKYKISLFHSHSNEIIESFCTPLHSQKSLH